MRRIAAVTFIFAYLSTLGWGIVAHTLHVGAYKHPAMYWVVWDMFCGWSGYAIRHEIIAEGESGTYYSLYPPPWNDFKPFGSLSRHHYDSYSAHAPRMAKNVLDHTTHEPITRIFLIERQWSKRYNIPDYTWANRHSGPKDRQDYYHIRTVMNQNAEVLKHATDWQGVQMHRFVMSNPKLKALASRGNSFINMTPRRRNHNEKTALESFVKPVSKSEMAYPLSN